MDLSLTAEHRQFQAQVRAFIDEAMPPHLREKCDADAHFSHDEVMEWHRILFQRGWVAPNWPEEYGGPGLDATSRFILVEELELAGAPLLSPFGLSMVGPLIIQFGTDEQKQRYLPKILSGDEAWCQGYSEPNAGSDLASLQTQAIKNSDGDYVVTGQKTWTTYAQYADWIFCLVRTSSGGRKQEGISFLLIDMKSAGVEVRPMLTTAGTPAFCETFFDGVVVPAANRVGPEGGGWQLAKALLGHERTLIAQVGRNRRAVERLKQIAKDQHRGARPLLEDDEFRARVARLAIELRGLQMTNLRALSGAQLGRAPGPESSILKLHGSEITQEAFDLAVEAMGEDGMSWFNEPGVVAPAEQWVPPTFNYTRATTIYGGSNEIQKNIIAKWILGLPSK